MFHVRSVQFFQVITLYQLTSTKNQLRVSLLHLYGECKNLPPAMRYGILESSEYIFQRNFFDEESIMKTITGQLKKVSFFFKRTLFPFFKENFFLFSKEILEFFAERFMARIQLFNEVETRHQLIIYSKMELKVHVQNEMVSKSNSKRHSVYFIYSGTVAAYEKNGREVQFFGSFCFS